MRQPATSDGDLAMWIEPAERNVPIIRHRAMIMCAHYEFFNSNVN